MHTETAADHAATSSPVPPVRGLSVAALSEFRQAKAPEAKIALARTFLVRLAAAESVAGNAEASAMLREIGVLLESRRGLISKREEQSALDAATVMAALLAHRVRDGEDRDRAAQSVVVRMLHAGLQPPERGGDARPWKNLQAWQDRIAAGGAGPWATKLYRRTYSMLRNREVAPDDPAKLLALAVAAADARKEAASA